MLDQVAVLFVSDNLYGHFLRLSTFLHGVDLTVVAEAQGSVLSDGEETHGIALEMGYLLVGTAVKGVFPHIESAVLLAEPVERLAVRSIHGVAVLTVECGDLGELAVLDILTVEGAAPDIAGD